MLRAKTLFVLGAGSSLELGFPAGGQLKEDIASTVRIAKEDWGLTKPADPEFFSRTSMIYSDPEVQRVSRKIGAGIAFASSIDNFLEIHAHDEALGRLAKSAIACRILRAERQSALATSARYPHLLESRRIEPSWYKEIAPLLFEGVPLSQLSDAASMCKVVSFNYDRSFEHFLHCAVIGLYDVQPVEAANVAASVEVLHPYGVVAPLDWQAHSDSLRYGAEYSGGYDRLGRNIKTFGEGVIEGNVRERLSSMMVGVKMVVFLGSAFHPANVDVFSGAASNAVSIIGTSFGMSDQDRVHVRSTLRKAFGWNSEGRWIYPDADNVVLESLTCAEFVQRYRRTLSSA